MAGPWIVGIVSEAGGLKLGMMMNVGYCLIMLAAALILMYGNAWKQAE